MRRERSIIRSDLLFTFQFGEEEELGCRLDTELTFFFLLAEVFWYEEILAESEAFKKQKQRRVC